MGKSHRLQKAFLKSLRQDALTKQRGTCMYCKSPLSARDATADHLIPRCRHGQDARENIVASCYSCNRAKGSLSQGQFWKLIKRDFPHGKSPDIISIWASRRIWKRTNLARKRIEKCAGIYVPDNHAGA